MRKILTLFISIYPFILSGQTDKLRDTIRIDEVLIRENSLETVIRGFRNKTIDTSILKEYLLESLPDVLTENSSLFIKNYGPGNSSTVSLRGTGATHTQLLWNELNINSPMLGQADLSLFPACFIDELRIFQGGPSMILGDGGLGGIISIETKPEWNDGTKLLINAGAGSFGRYSGAAKVRTGSDKFQSVTRAFYNNSRNDFTYLNTIGSPEPVTEQRKNASTNQSSFMQELYFKGCKSVTSASLWYNSMNRNLPSSLLDPQQNGAEKQEDESFRAVVRHNIYLLHTKIEAVGAWFSDRLHYTNTIYSIDSRNIMNTVFANAGTEAELNEKTHLKVNLNNEINLINSVNYSEREERWTTSATASIRGEFGERIGMVFLLREILENFKPMTPDFSTGMDAKVLRKNEGYVRLNLSKNSKVATINDMYWNPGGNPDLKNEYSLTGELSFDIKGNFTSSVHYAAEIASFAGRIKDMIQWVPGESGYWTPQNIAESGNHGIETNFRIDYRFNRGAVSFEGLYSYTRSYNLGINDNEHNQIIYIPVNQANTRIKVEYGKIYAGIITSFTGKRYTTEDNSDFLPGYILNNLLIGYKLKSGLNSFDISLKAENIFDVSYEIIEYYPMPGRSFMASVIYQFGR